MHIKKMKIKYKENGSTKEFELEKFYLTKSAEVEFKDQIKVQDRFINEIELVWKDNKLRCREIEASTMRDCRWIVIA